MGCDLPVLELIEGALRFGGSLLFFGRMVSLLGFRRRLPSTRPEAERSWFPIVACATDGTVSVSTVMLRRGGSARDLLESDDNEGFVDTVLGLCVEVVRFSCIFSFLLDFVALSLPLSVLLLLLSLVLRSSVTLDELTSLRSSSESFCKGGGIRKLWLQVLDKVDVEKQILGPLSAATCGMHIDYKKWGDLRGKTYSCESRPSKPGVAGRLDSWTVSSLGAAPLAPRDGALAVMTGSSASLAAVSSLAGKRTSEAGDAP